jgi:ABC-type branched-subunit amino acid transport system ATPase component
LLLIRHSGLNGGGDMALLQIRDVTRQFYGVHALNGVDLDVAPGIITGLIGPNGAGKTTLFIAGWRADRITRAGLVRTFQIARGCPRLTVRENLLLYGAAQPGEGVLTALLRTRAMLAREAVLQERAEAIAKRLRLFPVIDNPAAALSGGQKKLLEIGRALMTQPKLILLDEPLAGVNPTLCREIGERLQEIVAEGITLLLIEHQMDMIARLCDHVIVMAEGRRLTEGSFAEVAADGAVQDAYMGGKRWAS